MPPRRTLVAVTMLGALLQGGPALATASSPPVPPSAARNSVQATSRLPEDFGDAPESYHTDRADDGPMHLLSPRLMLGTTESSEDEARGDKDAASDDDDGLTTVPHLATNAAAYHLKVTVTNRLSSPAVLAGWLDGNGDGSFERSERVVTTVPPGATSATLGWTGLHGIKGKATYLRLRIYAHPPGQRTAASRPATSVQHATRHALAVSAVRLDDDCLPVGYGGIGEVEDYRVLIDPGTGEAAAIPSGVTFRKTADRYNVRPGDRVFYTITVTNNLYSPQSAAFTDYMARVLDDARYNRDAAATSGRPLFARGVLGWHGAVRPNHPVTVTYSVTVRGRRYGDGLLDNRIVSNRGNCVRGSWDPFCKVRVVRGGGGHPVRCWACHPFHHPFSPFSPPVSGHLPHTGAAILDMVRLAGLLLVFGTGALLLTQSRRRTSAATTALPRALR